MTVVQWRARPTQARHEASFASFQADAVLARLGAVLSDGVVILIGGGDHFQWPMIAWCNPAFEAMSGHASRDVVGRTPEMLFGAETSPAARARMLAAMAGGEKVQEELALYRDNGAPIWCDFAIHRIDAELEDQRVWVGIIRDVTDRRAYDSAITAAREEAATFFDLSLTAKCIMDGDGRFIRANTAFAELLGRPADSLVGENPLRWIHPDDVEPTRQAFTASLATNDVTTALNRYRDEQGKYHTIQWRAQHRGEQLFAVGWDMSRQLEAEAELRRKTIAAEAADAAKSNFLATMSHELRTPLNGVLGMLEMVMRENLPPKVRSQLQIAQQSSHELLATLNEILDFAKIEAGETRVELAPLDLKTVVDDVARLFSPRAIEKGLEFTFEIEPSAPMRVVGDARRIRQIVANFVSNAVKFTNSGQVKLTCRRLDTAIEIAVADTGPGIPTSEHGRVFTRFWQHDSGLSRKFEGSGLGLAIANELAPLMNGRVGFESQEGVGSRFWFQFPLVEVEDHDCEDDSEDVADIETNGDLRILVAEDHKVNQIVISEILKIGGHRFDIVENGVEAVEAAKSNHYDLILMDIQMPVMCGTEATLAIRALPGPVGAIPILAVTASARASDRERYLAAGMNDFISKPINVAELLQKVHAWGEGAPLAGETVSESEHA